MSLSVLTLTINIVLLLQFGYLTFISWLRWKNGKNGLTPFLLLVSAGLTGLVLIDMAYQVTVITGLMGNLLVMAPLQGVEMIIRTVLVVSNVVYFIAIKKEAMAPLKRMTRTRESLFDAVERGD